MEANELWSRLASGTLESTDWLSQDFQDAFFKDMNGLSASRDSFNLATQMTSQDGWVHVVIDGRAIKVDPSCFQSSLILAA